MKISKRKLRNKSISELVNTIGLFAWVLHTLGVILFHAIITSLLVFGTYFFVRTALLLDFWIMWLLFIIFGAGSLIGIGAVVIEICDIILICREYNMKNDSM